MTEADPIPPSNDDRVPTDARFYVEARVGFAFHRPLSVVRQHEGHPAPTDGRPRHIGSVSLRAGAE
jgi:hypothetical protein